MKRGLTKPKLILALMLVAFLSVVGPVEGTQDESLKVVLASEILSKIERGEPVEYNGVIIKGDLDLDYLNLDENHKIVNSLINITDSEIRGTLNFKNIIFQESVNFAGTNFSEDTDFEGTQFSRIVDFRSASFNGDFSDFEGAIFSDDADFSEAEFNGCIDFREALFRGNADFHDVQFKAELLYEPNFEFAQFREVVDFSGTRFNGWGTFRDVHFGGDTSFWDAQFNSSALFDRAQFSGDADFSETQFGGNVLFLGSNFDGAAIFERAQFNGDSYFRRVQFNGRGGFEVFRPGQHIEMGDGQSTYEYGGQYTKHGVIKRVAGIILTGDEDVSFNGVTFRGDAEFDNARFNGYTSFKNSLFRGNASFKCAKFEEHAYFDYALCLRNLILDDVKFSIIKTRWVFIEHSLVYNDAVYLALIKNFENLGYFKDADNCYYQYRKERQERETSTGSKLLDILAWLSCGYGVRPGYTLACSFGLIVFFGVAFWAGNGTTQRQETIYKNNKNTLSLSWSPLFNKVLIFFRNMSLIKRPSVLLEGFRKIWNLSLTKDVSLKDALYFSALVFFHTWPHPNLRPAGRWKYVVLVEDIFGWLLLALFLVTLANVMIR